MNCEGVAHRAVATGECGGITRARCAPGGGRIFTLVNGKHSLLLEEINISKTH